MQARSHRYNLGPLCAIAASFCLITALRTFARTQNGNDFCLLLSEAAERGAMHELADLKQDSKGVNYFFRYLKVLDIQSGRENNRPFVDLVTREPSSEFTLRFRVATATSLTLLMQAPETRKGHAVAVLGRAADIDAAARQIVLDPVVIRHKDRLEPTLGKEYLGETDPTARYYSYTAVPGKRVEVSYADKDLIERNRGRIPAFEASDAEKEAWADFLLAELAKRDKRRETERRRAQERAGVFRDSTNAPALRRYP